MNRKLTFSGGEPTINFDDLDRNNKANLEALIAAFRAYGDNYIIQGVTGATSITAGYIMLDGEIIQVDAHTKTSTHFVKAVTFDANGDKTFNDATPRQTWQKNRATITAGSGSLAYSGAKRMPDVLVDTITVGTSIFAPANLPKATTSLEGIRETATDTEAKALASTTKIIVPSNLSAVNGGVLTKIVEIGDWDMDTNAAPASTIPHGLTLSKIRSVRTMIRADVGASLPGVFPIWSAATGSANDNGGSVNAGTTNVGISRRAGGFFDNTDFNSTSYNRGWIIIEHTP